MYVTGEADWLAVAGALGDAVVGVDVVDGWPLGEGDGPPCVAAGGAQAEVNAPTRSSTRTCARAKRLMPQEWTCEPEETLFEPISGSASHAPRLQTRN
jgi:hypothetical protein